MKAKAAKETKADWFGIDDGADGGDHGNGRRVEKSRRCLEANASDRAERFHGALGAKLQLARRPIILVR